MNAKLTIKNSCDLRTILFQTGFEQEYFFVETFGNPEYELIIEGEENEKGEVINTRKEWRKYFIVKEPVRESTYIALMVACICDRNRLTDELGQTYDIKEMTCDIDWTLPGYGLAEIKFVIDSVVLVKLEDHRI